MDLIPCFNFPGKLLILDDNGEFLESIQDNLSKKYQCICVTEFNRAQNIINNNQAWVHQLLSKAFGRSFDMSDSSLYATTIEIERIKDQIYDAKRFNHILVMIIDYDMPGMTGLDFIQTLGDHQIKIIMLTGKAGQDTVIKAFNDKKIHRYISKGNPDYLQITLQYIKELQKEFFIDSSKMILDSLKIETSIFSHPLFIEQFNKIIDENKIIEYYLLDESGSFLFLDATAENQILLITKSKMDMRLQFELAIEDSNTPTYVIQKLKNKEVFTHFRNKKESFLSAKYWHLIDAKPLDETEEFYYAILKNDEDFSMNRSEVKSYSDFLNSI